jgi:hypothetical protein
MMGQSVNLEWDASPSPGVTGYIVLYGTNGVNYFNQTDVGANLSATMSGLQLGSNNYFEVVAYNSNRIRSVPSNPIQYNVPITTLTLLASPANGGTVIGGGSYAGGTTVSVIASANDGYTFSNWTQNGVVQSTASIYNFDLTTNCTLVANFTVTTVPYTVAVQVNPANAGSVSGGGTFASGSTVTVTATANSGYTFTNWTENGIVQSTSPNYTFTLTTNRNLVANFAPISVTYTVATQMNPAGAGSVSGGGSFTAGSSVTVRATANSGYTFTNWTENGIVQSASPNYTFTLTTNRNLVANFTVNPINYTVTTLAAPTNAGSVTGGGTFVTGSSVTVTATANSGYTFTNWTENGVVQSDSTNYAFTVTANATLVANFTTNPVFYTVATQVNPAGGGSVTGGGTFVAGSSVTVTATANSGYTFVNWTENGVVQSSFPNYSFTLATNRNLVANFALNPTMYTVATQINPANAGSVTGGGTFAAGSSVTVTATANSGYTFSNWTENGVMLSDFPNYNFTLATNRNLIANFTLNPVTYAVATQVNPVNAGSVVGGGTYAAGSSVTVTAIANSGYTFSNWTENGIVQSTFSNYSFTLATNRNLVANFTVNPITYAVNTQVSPVNAGSVTGGGTFVTGSSITVTATANSGYTFTNWTQNGIVLSTSPIYNFTLVTNVNLVANFTVNPIVFTVDTQVDPTNAGSVTGDGTFAIGTSVTVVATNYSGYTFANWTENGSVQSESTNYTFTLETNRNLVANFTTNPGNYVVATLVNPASAGSVAGGGTFVTGSSVTVTATANSGYTFANWTENGSVLSASPSYNFTLTTNCTLVANFTVNPNYYTVATQMNPVGAGSVTGGGTFVAGSSVTVTATANSGYTFTNWTQNGIVLSASSSYNFTLATNVNLVANFTVNPVTYTVETQADPTNAGSVTDGGTFVAGSTVTVIATNYNGYTFTNWTENGIVQSESTNYTFTLETNRNLVANFTTNPIIYAVATQISPANAGSVTGGGSFVAGSSVTVTATANSGYTFFSWTENGVVQSTYPNYTFTLATNRNLQANFTLNPTMYTVETQADPTNAGSVTGGGTFVEGASVTVTATANPGYTFSNWTENGIVMSTFPNYSFTLATNRNLLANFTANQINYTVAAQANPANAGTITGGGTFAAGSSVSVTAVANSGYTFSNWTENGVLQSTFPNYSFTLATNRNLVANFTVNPITYTVAAQANPPSAGSVTGGGTFVTGSSVTVTATANSGYTFTNWTQNVVVMSTSPNYNFTLVTNVNLVANFTANTVTYTVTPSAGTNGSINPSTPQSVTTGSSVSFTATPATNYQVFQWLVNGVVAQSGGAAFTLQNVTTNNSVVVTFGAAPTNFITTNVILAVSGKGTLSPKLNTYELGRKYTVTALPGIGMVFSNWVSNGVVVSAAARYTFIAESNLLLQANFITNPFVSIDGSYSGLFYDTNGPAEESSGAFFTTVTSSGFYSARAVLGALTYSFSGELPLTGAVSKSIPRPGLSPLAVQFQVDLASGPITGTISDGAWTANLEADHAIYSEKNKAPQAGKYTLLIPGNINGSTPPGGNGYATLTVSTLGTVSLTGTLGDGTLVTSSGTVGSQDQWPLYISLYGGKGSILGWLSFNNYGDMGGQIAWFKQPQKTAKIYPGGFTYGTEAIGSVYKYTAGFPVLGYAYGELSLINGDLEQDISEELTLWPQITAANPNTCRLTVNSLNGMFTGSVLNPGTDKMIPFNGVILQNQNFGAGLFLGTNQSGSVFLLRAQ